MGTEVPKHFVGYRFYNPVIHFCEFNALLPRTIKYALTHTILIIAIYVHGSEHIAILDHIVRGLSMEYGRSEHMEQAKHSCFDP